MRLYLDDDSVDKSLVARLRGEGHDVFVPPTAGQRQSVHDAHHLANAIRDGRAVLTKNYVDFEAIGKLVTVAGGHHPGILIRREDQDKAKNMSIAQVVKAMENVARNAGDTTDQIINLNDRRVY